MLRKQKGKHSYIFESAPKITAWASVAGKKEAEGPLNNYFDQVSGDTMFGQSTWEQAESMMQKTAIDHLLNKAGIQENQIDCVFSCDLLNQCIGSAFTLKNKGISQFGLYGACSTMSESMLLAAMAVDGGFANRAIALTSSHFASAERQYRFPLGYGGQRTPTSQWTVTGSGALLIEPTGYGPEIRSCTVGSVVDLGIKDANNMGAAMAPAAYSTIKMHLQDLNLQPSDYDLIVTGDLGRVGSDVLRTLAAKEGLILDSNLVDCGTLVFDLQSQDVHAGGSGCGCSAIVLCGYLLDLIVKRKIKRLLFCGTGALMSPTSTQQGMPIPGVCHAVCIESEA